MRPRPDSDLDDDAPSRSQLKREAEAIRDLGVELLEVPEERLAHPEIPDRVRTALLDYRRFPTMEAKRRQMQYIAKLLRSEDVAPLEAAVLAHRRNKERDAQTLHQAEQWRDRVLESDEGWQQWCDAVPAGNTRQLRGLLTNARREQAQAADVAQQRGEAPRKGKLYRELFQKLRAALLAHNAAQDGPASDE